tara:strand:- start:6457 stop:6975 length:519 start_codon:yes stop_codon:yes gene_type:complete
MNFERLHNMHQEVCSAARATMVQKNHDYTSGSQDPFANFRNSSKFGVHPVLGIMIRMDDKMMRVKTWIENKGKLKVNDESVLDSIDDNINYLILMRGMIVDEIESDQYSTNVHEIDEPEMVSDRDIELQIPTSEGGLMDDHGGVVDNVEYCGDDKAFKGFKAPKPKTCKDCD